MEVVMSEHIFSETEGRWDIKVGWTEALDSFFVIVWDVNDVDDSPVFLAGWLTEKIETVEQLAGIVSPYGDIPDDILSMLRDDKAGLTPL
jgi:hypothetical protein